MAQLEIESTYTCDVHTFWEDFYFLEDYGRAVYLEGLGFRRWQRLLQEDDGEVLRRRVLLEKPLSDEIPGAVRKLAGDGLTFHEEGRFDRAAARYDFTLVAERFQKSGAIRGWVKAEPHPEGCLRRVHLDVQVRLLGLGKLVERALLEGFASGYRDGVVFGNQLLARRNDLRNTRDMRPRP